VEADRTASGPKAGRGHERDYSLRRIVEASFHVLRGFSLNFVMPGLDPGISFQELSG
jgi:hypothetical protein